MADAAMLEDLLNEISQCRLCRDAPRYGKALPQEPRPVCVASTTARILIAGQAPGTRVHASGIPFNDPSGDRLRAWRDRVMAALPQIRLILVIGQYAQAYHLGKDREKTLTATVANWRAIRARQNSRRLYVLPHPSWRNNSWLKKNPWFEEDLLPELRQDVSNILSEQN